MSHWQRIYLPVKEYLYLLIVESQSTKFSEKLLFIPIGQIIIERAQQIYGSK